MLVVIGWWFWLVVVVVVVLLVLDSCCFAWVLILFNSVDRLTLVVVVLSVLGSIWLFVYGWYFWLVELLLWCLFVVVDWFVVCLLNLFDV